MLSVNDGATNQSRGESEVPFPQNREITWRCRHIVEWPRLSLWADDALLGESWARCFMQKHGRLIPWNAPRGIHLDGLSPYTANLCPIRCGGQRVIQECTLVHATILHKECGVCNRFLLDPTAEPPEPRPEGASRLSLVRQFDRKEKMKPIHRTLRPSSYGRAPMKLWPVINAKSPNDHQSGGFDAALW